MHDDMMGTSRQHRPTPRSTGPRRRGRRRTLGATLLLLMGLIGAGSPAHRAEALTTEALLDTLQHTAFNYFWLEANPTNGLIRDRSQSGSPASIAAVGFGLSAICIGVDHGWITRTQGAARVLTTLNTFWTYPQGSAANGIIGYRGLFYHFLDMTTGFRTWDCELSTIDTALLFGGILDAKQYFNGSNVTEIQIRALADSLYRRADWNSMRNFSQGIMMGWKPGTGFNGFGQWIGYNEAMILYTLAIGSPTHATPASSWDAWVSGYNNTWGTYYGQTYLGFAPLFGHQYSHCWIDYRNINDTYMTGKGITYFENSRRATLAQQAYCIANPLGRVGYSAVNWGLTASDGPFGYNARGAPPAQNDDGTITPTAPAGSIAFAPEIVIPTLHNFYDSYQANLWGPYGFRDAFNPTYNWWGTDYLGIDQGPIIIGIENYRTGKVWQRFMLNPEIQLGLQRSGFNSVTGVEEESGAPRPGVALLQNNPNPFVGSTRISFRLDHEAPVLLRLYDVQGRFVRTLLDGVRPAGTHEVPLDATGLRGGTYYYRLKSDGHETGRACTVLR